MLTKVFPAKTPRELDEKMQEIISGGYIPTMACVFAGDVQSHS